MKRIFTMILLAVACQQVEPLVEPEVAEGPEFSAQIEEFGAETKTALAFGNSVVWSAGDQLAIFQGESVADKYQVKSDCVGTTSGTFEIVANGSGTPEASFQTNIAVYPYEDDLVCTPFMEDGAVVSYQITGVTIPSVQTYVPDSFPDESFLMAAMSDGREDHTLNFKNLCGVLKLQLKGTVKVKTIELKGNGYEKLSGKATIEVRPDALPVFVMIDEASSVITLDCGDGVQLSNNVATDFYIAVPPTDFEKGFIVKVIDVTGAEDEIKTSKSNPVKKSYVHAMPTITVETAFPEEIDLFVFAGQSNMMGAAHLAPVDNPVTMDSYEYKYQNVLKGGDKGEFVYAQNPAGDWHYMDTEVAYGEQYLDVATGKSKQANYSSTMYFIPACRDQEKGFSGQSEYQNYPSATMAPYFAQYYSELGRKCIYAHMAKGSCKIVHYFTTDAMEEYNRLISEYNSTNSTSYATLTSSDLSGAGDAFDAKYKLMLRDYAEFAPDKVIANKCFVWLQGESDVHVYAQYKLRLQALWTHLQSLGFTHFFILRVGFWGSTAVINEIKAQTDFCAENENCYIVTKAPSLIPHPSANTTNWWISEPSSEYADCRDSYLASTSNHHFNEKAHKIFARRSAENINRILHLGLPPILEEENIKGL